MENIRCRKHLILPFHLLGTQHVRIPDDRCHRRFDLMREICHELFLSCHHSLQFIHMLTHCIRHLVVGLCQCTYFIVTAQMHAALVIALSKLLRRPVQRLQRLRQKIGNHKHCHRTAKHDNT